MSAEPVPMSHCCHHDQVPGAIGHSHAPADISPRKLGLAVALTLGLVLAEVIAGTLAHSLAVLGDAGHNFADAAALGFSWYALWIAAKPANAGMTFGYHRVGILAAFGNAIFLVVVAVALAAEAVSRLSHPQPVNSLLMSAAAGIAIVVNVLIGVWLHAGSKHDLNLRGAYLHMLADAVSAAGVVAAGVLVGLTHWAAIDPIVSFVISGLIMYSSWGILVQSVRVLLEGAPAGLDINAVLAHLRRVPGARDVHDLHVWTVGTGVLAASCHVVVDEQSVRGSTAILASVADMLRRDFRIGHTTVQIEAPGCCDEVESFCTMTSVRGGTAVAHAH